MCPVCEYPGVPDQPEDHTICPVCVTHFGYDDYASTPVARAGRWATLRQAWRDRGQRGALTRQRSRQRTIAP